ncbi:hypothetical protein F383_32627 [Gossypium arboreum]|uniref:Uncharacterized protein n=1 Tax=Gossypium arboreum TaxID=29729 RepID=A0A0B0PKV3_GOSAR|nr:hypothetical protein F383_32627 [Gossypium arboreum]
MPTPSYITQCYIIPHIVNLVYVFVDASQKHIYT